MSPTTPRQRAIAALAVIDGHHDGQWHGHTSPCPMYAFAELAEAMNQIYGPLPDERLVAVRTQIEREER